MDINLFKGRAREKFADETEPTQTNPITYLYSKEWNVPVGPPFPELELAEMNVDLDERGCFGRLVRAAVLAENHFPERYVRIYWDLS